MLAGFSPRVLLPNHLCASIYIFATRITNCHYRALRMTVQAELGSSGQQPPAKLAFSLGKRLFHSHSEYLWKSRRNAVANGPGLPLPIMRPSIRMTGMTIWLAPVMKASRAS